MTHSPVWLSQDCSFFSDLFIKVILFIKVFFFKVFNKIFQSNLNIQRVSNVYGEQSSLNRVNYILFGNPNWRYDLPLLASHWLVKVVTPSTAGARPRIFLNESCEPCLPLSLRLSGFLLSSAHGWRSSAAMHEAACHRVLRVQWVHASIHLLHLSCLAQQKEIKRHKYSFIASWQPLPFQYAA